MDELTDRFVSDVEAKTLIAPHFKNEKEFCDYLELNIRSFCEEDLNVKLAAYKREFLVDSLRSERGFIGKKADFLIASTNGQNILIECKSAKYDSLKAIGQLLMYKRLLLKRGIVVDRMVIVCSFFCEDLGGVVTDFKLPIELFFMDKDKCISR